MWQNKTYICPFCFNKNNLYEVEFRCASDARKCAREADQKYSDFWGLGQVKYMAKVIPVPSPTTPLEKLKAFIKIKVSREMVCPSCKGKTSKRICPTCHSELPYTIGDYKDMIFAVIGSKDSGKSHYISVLITKIMNEIGTAFDCNLQPLSDETINRYRQDFYQPVYRKKEIIKGTVSARANRAVKMPLIYSLSFMGQNMFGKKQKMDVATVAFFDTAGEDMKAEDTMSTENKYIYNSSGIILLLDPLQMSEVRAQLPRGTPLPDQNTETVDIISRTATLIRRAHGIRQEELIDIPIAVAFSKIDAIQPLLDPSSSLLHDSKHNGCFNIDDFDSMEGEMESLIREWSSNSIIAQVEHNFRYYGFFGLTALGCNPHNTLKIPKLRPHRVEDPFLWLLWKHRLISGSDEYDYDD